MKNWWKFDKGFNKTALLGSVAVGALVFGVMYYGASTNEKCKEPTCGTRVVTPASESQTLTAQITGTLTNGAMNGTVKFTLPSNYHGKSSGDIGYKTESQEWWDNAISIAWSIAGLGFLGLAGWAFMRYVNSKTPQVQVGPGGQPAGTHIAAGAPDGAPAGADLSFMEIIQPEDNGVRLEHLILDEGLADELRDVADGIKEYKTLYEEARQAAIAEAKAKEKKNSGWGGGNNSPAEPKIDMSGVKVKKPAAGIFGGGMGHAWLYTGDPGVGKTYAATAVAGSAGVPIIIIAGSMENTLLGGGAERVKIVMAIARKLGPCIIFVDEAEQAAGQRQTTGMRFGASSDGTTAAWLAAMDGARQKVARESEFMDEAEMINFIMATNHPDMVDKAAKRAGRMEPVQFTLPTVPLLQKMLKLFISKKKVPLGDDIDHEFLAIATMLNGKSGADIAAIANSFAKFCQKEVKKLQKRLQREKKSAEEIQAAIASLKFGQQSFIYGMLDHLMGKRILNISEDFVRDFNTTVHELFHALCGAVSGKLGLYDEVMRLMCVDRRQKSLGVCMWSPKEGSRTSMSVKDVLGLSILGYGGGASQMVVNEDAEKFGLEFDLHRDSGTTGDNDMAANLIKDSVAQHHGSLVLGPISKGLKGQTFASEMGDQMVNAVDREIQWRQRLGFSVAHKIAGFMITHPIIWEMIEEVLNSKDRIMIQERFYTYFERLCADKRIAAEIEKLPAFIKSEEEQYRKDPNYVWLPQRQPKKVRDTIVANQAKLKVAYDEYQKQNAADVAADVAAEAAAELEVADPAEQAAELKSAIPPCLLGWKSKNVAPAAEADVPAEAKAEADKGAKPARKGLLGFLGW